MTEQTNNTEVVEEISKSGAPAEMAEPETIAKADTCPTCGQPTAVEKAADEPESKEEDAKETPEDEKKEDMKKSLWDGSFSPQVKRGM